MFNLLDDTLKKLLDAAPPSATGVRFGDADISFETPAHTFKPKRGDKAINLFLYEVKENRELRQPTPTRELTNSMGVLRRAPLRVDCSYMVTAWSNNTNQDNVENAHRLLGQAFNWLSRFPVIPEQYILAAGMTGQVFSPPTMVAQMDGAKSAGEFWHALGIPPRPYFNLVVTICMDLDQSVEDSIVTTTLSRYYQQGAAASAEDRITIGGTVRDLDGNPVRDAWVLLQPAGLTRVTDTLGHFILPDVERGSGFSLHARAPGFQTVDRSNLEIPSLSGEYDLRFTSRA